MGSFGDGAVFVVYAAGAIGALLLAEAAAGADVTSGANSTVNVDPGPKPGGMTMALTRPSGACT